MSSSPDYHAMAPPLRLLPRPRFRRSPDATHPIAAIRSWAHCMIFLLSSVKHKKPLFPCVSHLYFIHVPHWRACRCTTLYHFHCHFFRLRQRGQKIYHQELHRLRHFLRGCGQTPASSTRHACLEDFTVLWAGSRRNLVLETDLPNPELLPRLLMPRSLSRSSASPSTPSIMPPELD